jgi:hypothetical protein
LAHPSISKMETICDIETSKYLRTVRDDNTGNSNPHDTAVRSQIPCIPLPPLPQSTSQSPGRSGVYHSHHSHNPPRNHLAFHIEPCSLTVRATRACSFASQQNDGESRRGAKMSPGLDSPDVAMTTEDRHKSSGRTDPPHGPTAPRPHGLLWHVQATLHVCCDEAYRLSRVCSTHEICVSDEDAMKATLPYLSLSLSLSHVLSCNKMVYMKNGVFGDVTPCGSCNNRRFGGT